jgi:hypothetical protein
MAMATRQAKTTSRVGNEALKEKTAKTWAEWFSLLDKDGANKLNHQAIVALLMDKHKLGQWWGQMVAVGYEQERGLRAPHQKPNGFEITASKTINVPIGMAFMMFEDAKMRKRWMRDTPFEIRKSTSNKRLLVNWPDATNVVIDFLEKGANKTQVVVQQSKLPSARSAEKQKAYWGQQLDQLKTTVEK